MVPLIHTFVVGPTVEKEEDRQRLLATELFRYHNILCSRLYFKFSSIGFNMVHITSSYSSRGKKGEMSVLSVERKQFFLFY